MNVRNLFLYGFVPYHLDEEGGFNLHYISRGKSKKQRYVIPRKGLLATALKQNMFAWPLGTFSEIIVEFCLS